MCLTISNKSRSQKRALLTTTAMMCLFTATGTATALQTDTDQDAKVIVAAASEETAESVTVTAAAPVAAAGLIKQADTDVYDAAFFDQYAPQNAMEMIERLPGFSFDQGSNVRGFGGAAGNVLIDGSRPTSKSGGLRAALQRIPAAQVLRIEILRGGVSGGEAAGQSTVANVIRSQTGTSGTWALKTRRTPDGRLKPNVEAAISSKLGQWDTTFDFDLGSGGGNRSADIEDLDANGVLESSSRELRPAENEWLWVSGEGSRPLAGGKLTLNGRFGGFNWNGDTSREGFTGRMPDDSPHDDFWLLNEREEKREAELGVDWAKTYSNSWKLRMIGLASSKDSLYTNTYHFEDFINPSVDDSTYLQDTRKKEFILRSTYGLTSGKFKPEFGVELAKNQLKSDIESSSDGVPDTPEALTVNEYRGEAFATFVYQASDKLSLDGGLTFEASKIKVPGEFAPKPTRKFLKPRISATYAFSDDVQLTLEAEKKVGQLNLGLFAPSTDPADGRVIAGNTNLRPDKKTRTAATFDWKFSERGSIKAEAYYEWRKDILEEIVLGPDDVGRGNAGDARFYGFKVEANVPLDSVLKGGLLEVEYSHRRSSFEDPLLGGETRRISWYTPSWLKFEFRQDITTAKMAWGVEYWGSFLDTGYLVSEIQSFKGNKRLNVFVETTRYFGVKMKLDVRFVNTAKFTRTRLFFDEDRGGEFTGSEVAHRVRRPEFRFDITGTF